MLCNKIKRIFFTSTFPKGHSFFTSVYVVKYMCCSFFLSNAINLIRLTKTKSYVTILRNCGRYVTVISYQTMQVFLFRVAVNDMCVMEYQSVGHKLFTLN